MSYEEDWMRYEDEQRWYEEHAHWRWWQHWLYNAGRIVLALGALIAMMSGIIVGLAALLKDSQ